MTHLQVCFWLESTILVWYCANVMLVCYRLFVHVKHFSKSFSVSLPPNLFCFSALQPNAGQQKLQGAEFLVGFLDFAVRLNVTGDVEADLVHKRDGISFLSGRHVPSILSDHIGKLWPFHQLKQTRLPFWAKSSKKMHTQISNNMAARAENSSKKLNLIMSIKWHFCHQD